MKTTKNENYKKIAEQMPIEDKVTASIFVNFMECTFTLEDVATPFDFIEGMNEFINKYHWVLSKEGFEAIKPFKSLDNI